MKKKILLTLVIFVAVFAMSSVAKIVLARPTHNSSGWLWGGGAEPDGSLPGDGTNTNFGWVSMNNSNQAGAIDYGVNIPSDGSAASGYAWSENVGWISFNVADLSGCPSAPCDAKLNTSTKKLEGWARIIGIRDAGANAGGWSGWIKLSGLTVPGNQPYGVTFNADGTTAANSYAWSDELGWVDFSKMTTGPIAPPTPPTVTITANPGQIILDSGEDLTTLLPVTDKTVELKWTVGGGSATSCTASCGPIGDCSTWDDSTSKSFSAGDHTENVVMVDDYAEFIITCTNGTDSDTASIPVYVGCYDKGCTSGTCGNAGAFVQTETHTCSIGCTSDIDCASSTRSTGGYREVAP